MVSEDRFKSGASRGVAVDQLLEEYLRVINDKDDQLHRLLRQLEDERASSRRNDEIHKEQLKELTQQLHRREAKVKELQQQHTHAEELNSKLTHHMDALKVQLQSNEEKVQKLQESASKMSDSICGLENSAAALRSTVAALESQREKDGEALANTQQLLRTEQCTTSSLRVRCEALTQSLEERQSQLEQLQTQMRSMMHLSEHTEIVQALEKAAATARIQFTRELDHLQHQLQRNNEECSQSQKSLSCAQSKVAELTDTLHSTVTTLQATRQELSSTAAAAQQTEKELREEMARRKATQQEQVERISDLERALVRANDAAQRTSADLQAAQLQHERYKAGTEKALDAGKTQLCALQEQLRQAQEETDATRRRLETRERAARDDVDAALQLRNQVARVEAESREKAATLAAVVAAKTNEADRLQSELKKAQEEQRDAQRRTTADERALSQKLEELQVAVYRLQSQLRDKEEEVRRLELVHSGEVQKIKHDFASSTEDMRRRHEVEVRDLNQRIDRFRSELGEQTGSSNSFVKELQHLSEARWEMRKEVDRMQGALEMKEAVLQNIKKELEKQQADVAQLTQRLAAREREETATRQRLEEAQRVQLDLTVAAEQAQETVTTLKKAADSTAAAMAALEEQRAKKDTAMADLRREVEELLESRQTALKEVMQQKAQRDQLALKLANTEERLVACESDLRNALQEHKRQQRALEEGKDELRRLQDKAEQRSAECACLAKHAEEVEALARRTSDELHRSLEARDDIIRQLRAEQATVLPHLNEEKSKLLLLQEKLQHQQEVHRRDAEAAEERVRALQAAQAAREADIAVMRAEKAQLEQKVIDATAHVETLKATLESREHKYQQRKEEIQKALNQVEEVKAATATTLQEAETQSAAANALREKYKKEKAKMEAVLQRMELKVRESVKSEKEGRQREASLMEKLTDAETALRRLQDSMESRVYESKLRYEELCRQQEESFRDAAIDAQAAEKQTKTLQTQLLDAQRRAASAENCLRELQRQFTARQMLATEAFAEEYAEEAEDLKRVHLDAVLRAHRTLLTCAANCVKDGWEAAQRSVESSRLTAAELERQLTRMEAKHKAEMQAVEEIHARQLEAAASEHQEEILRLQRKATEAERAAELRRDALQRTDDDRDERCRALEDAVERLRGLLDLEKEQTAAYRDRVAAEEVKRSDAERAAQEERRVLLRSHDKLKRQLEDCAVERQHNEAELREQRTEVAALQRALAEKEREYKQELGRLQKEAETTSAAITARDAAVKECKELRQQVDFARGQLESSRASHQRVLNEQQATQRTRDARLEAAQAELATVAAEKQRLQADLSSNEQRVNELNKEVRALRRQEADLLGQLQARKSEIAALRERCANLESLKNISDAALAETQTRERDLMEKIEELRNAQQLMQLCFDKQQEQLEIGRRLRKQDVQMNSRYAL